MSLDVRGRLGPYEITASLGAGGMGQVYRARDTRLGRDVAVKVLPEHLANDANALGRFQREARAVAALSHPSILALYDVGDDKGIAYAVTELLVGETLRAHIGRGPMSAGRAITVAVSIADGLAAAHQKGIVHRDLKPENVFITDDGRVKILDFGLAKSSGPDAGGASPGTETQHTLPGTVLGTLGYMSPEQVRGDEVDARTDIFALGVVLYEMLTGLRAFPGRTQADIISAILREDPIELVRADGNLPAAVKPTLVRCLAKLPDRRYASARDLRMALEAARAATEDQTSAASIAVLPFVDMSPNRDQDYFCEGMAEELINGLARIEGVRVAARSSAFQFKGHAGDVRRIGEALNVRTVLEGSVRTAGRRLRVTAQLNDAANGYQIWSKRYDREMEDVFDIQDEIASDIIAALQVRWGTTRQAPRLKRYTDNLEAYLLYLQGRYHWFSRTKGGLQRALQYFEQAIAEDPTYALAYTGLSDLHSVRGIYGFVQPHTAFAAAEAAAERALGLDEALAEGHHSMAAIDWLYEFDWVKAERGFRRSIELNPSNAVTHCWYAHFLSNLGRPDEAGQARERSQAIDPLSAYVNGMAGLLLVGERREEEAILECRKALDTEPDYLVALYAVAAAYTRLQRHEQAVAAAERAASLADRAPFYLGMLGTTYAMAGRLDDARRVLSELEALDGREYVAPLFLSWVLGGLGELDRAFDCLEQAYQQRNGFLVLRGLTPFDSLRGDPRFADLMRRMELRG